MFSGFGSQPCSDRGDATPAGRVRPGVHYPSAHGLSRGRAIDGGSLPQGRGLGLAHPLVRGAPGFKRGVRGRLARWPLGSRAAAASCAPFSTVRRLPCHSPAAIISLRRASRPMRTLCFLARYSAASVGQGCGRPRGKGCGSPSLADPDLVCGSKAGRSIHASPSCRPRASASPAAAARAARSGSVLRLPASAQSASCRPSSTRPAGRVHLALSAGLRFPLCQRGLVDGTFLLGTNRTFSCGADTNT